MIEIILIKLLIIYQALIKKIFELSFFDNYLFFNDVLYKQVNDVAIGQPVAPTLANIFFSFNEKSSWMVNGLHALNQYYIVNIKKIKIF